jgi:predicted murein hydrolase (TIGR00659 family)
MTELFTSKVFSITITFLVFFIAQKVYAHWKFALLNPVLVTIIVLMAFLKVTHIKYDDYFKGAQMISFFLGPAVVALGVPLYLQLATIKKHGKAILLSVFIGSLVGILAAAGIAAILGASKAVIISIAPKSATTPIAMGIVERLGGIPALTAVIVIATGILGGVVGPWLLQVIGVKSPTAFGLAMGAASHGIGTARAVEEGEVQGALSGLALCLNGIFTAILTPGMLKVLFGLFSRP